MTPREHAVVAIVAKIDAIEAQLATLKRDVERLLASPPPAGTSPSRPLPEKPRAARPPAQAPRGPYQRPTSKAQVWRDRTPVPSSPRAVAAQQWREAQAATGGTCGGCGADVLKCYCVTQQRAYSRSARRSA